MNATARLLVRALPVLALAGGCLAKPALSPQLFSLDPPATAEQARRPASIDVLSVRRAQVAPPFDHRELVYRTGDHRLERDPYASFAAPPADLLTGAVRAYLRNAGVARDVVDPGGELRADLVVEVYVDELSGDLRHPAEADALLTLRFVVAPGGPERHRGPPLLEKEYSSRTRAGARTANAIATAWNEALAAIMQTFVRDVEPVLARASAPAGTTLRP